jgi:prevent-host-death family protein
VKIASVASVKAKFSGYIEDSKGGPIVVTKNGRPVAVLLSMQDDDEIERLLMAYSPKLKRIVQTAERQIRAGKGMSHRDFWENVSKGS